MSSADMTPDEQRADTLPAHPPCHCKPPVPWAERKYDGCWEEQGLEQRTCRECGASLTVEVSR